MDVRLFCGFQRKTTISCTAPKALISPVSGLYYLSVDSVFSGFIIAEVVPRRSNRPSVAAMSPKQCAAPKKYP
jgi:hypothetical protein